MDDVWFQKHGISTHVTLAGSDVFRERCWIGRWFTHAAHYAWPAISKPSPATVCKSPWGFLKDIVAQQRF